MPFWKKKHLCLPVITQFDFLAGHWYGRISSSIAYNKSRQRCIKQTLHEINTSMSSRILHFRLSNENIGNKYGKLNLIDGISNNAKNIINNMNHAILNWNICYHNFSPNRTATKLPIAFVYFGNRVHYQYVLIISKKINKKKNVENLD